MFWNSSQNHLKRSSFSSMIFHIRRSHLQAYKLKHSAKYESISLIPQDFGYTIGPHGLVPRAISENKMPEDFPYPCNCKKCARETVCVCRKKEILCCDFCKRRRECKYTTVSIHFSDIYAYVILL